MCFVVYLSNIIILNDTVGWLFQQNIYEFKLVPSSMLTTSGGHFWNHWFRLKVEYKRACKTLQFN